LAVDLQKTLLPCFSRAARRRGKNFGLSFSLPTNLMGHAFFSNVVELTLGILGRFFLRSAGRGCFSAAGATAAAKAAEQQLGEEEYHAQYPRRHPIESPGGGSFALQLVNVYHLLSLQTPVARDVQNLHPLAGASAASAQVHLVSTVLQAAQKPFGGTLKDPSEPNVHANPVDGRALGRINLALCDLVIHAYNYANPYGLCLNFL